MSAETIPVLVLLCLCVYGSAFVLNKQWIPNEYFAISTKTILSMENVHLLISTYMESESTMLEPLLEPMHTHEQATPQFLYAYLLARLLENIFSCLESTCKSSPLPTVAPEVLHSLLTALFSHLDRYESATLESALDLIKVCGTHFITLLPEKRTSDDFVAGMNMIIHGLIAETILQNEKEDFKSALYVLDRFYFERYYGALPDSVPNPSYPKRKAGLMQMIQNTLTPEKIIEEILAAMDESSTLKAACIDCLISSGVLPPGARDVPVSEQMLEELLVTLDVLVPIPQPFVPSHTSINSMWPARFD
ncbi:unnamed protein product [Sphagnum compactum]